MTMKTELTAMQKDLTGISKKLEKLITAVEKSGKATATKASKAKAVKVTPAKKAPRAPAKKKAVKATATDQVLKIINRLKRGADTATLMKKKQALIKKRSGTFLIEHSNREKSKEWIKGFMSV